MKRFFKILILLIFVWSCSSSHNEGKNERGCSKEAGKVLKNISKSSESLKSVSIIDTLGGNTIYLKTKHNVYNPNWFEIAMSYIVYHLVEREKVFCVKRENEEKIYFLIHVPGKDNDRKKHIYQGSVGSEIRIFNELGSKDKNTRYRFYEYAFNNIYPETFTKNDYMLNRAYEKRKDEFLNNSFFDILKLLSKSKALTKEKERIIKFFYDFAEINGHTDLKNHFEYFEGLLDTNIEEAKKDTFMITDEEIESNK